MTSLPQNPEPMLTILVQAASALESFKMESPVKKLQMDAQADKENIQARYDADEVAVPIKGIPVAEEEPAKDTAVVAVAQGIKQSEKDEPILQENPQRFVLFPIKYHEVCRC